MTKILVIDDTEEIRSRMKQLLTYEGYEVLGAESGQVGIHLAKTYHPDLIICDIIMPGMNGYRVLSELRKDPITATIPFIFLTARTASKNIRRGMNLGADDYLTKPFEVDDLLAAITARLAKHATVKKQMDELRINVRSILPNEIWTSLADITAFSELLADQDSLSESRESTKIGAIIHETSLRLQCLVENYLMYAQLKLIACDPEGREQWPPDESIDTKKFVTFLAEHQAECANRQEDLVLDLTEANIWIAPKSLQEIIMQLLNNAFTFSEPGMRVHVTTYTDGNQIVLRFTDYGQGMTPEKIAGLEAQKQVKSAWDEPTDSGFGLRICRLLVQLHGGELTITSEPKTGTTVTVAFRRRDDAQE
jgi:DNA-binding response OmpR family regulator